MYHLRRENTAIELTDHEVEQIYEFHLDKLILEKAYQQFAQYLACYFGPNNEEKFLQKYGVPACALVSRDSEHYMMDKIVETYKSIHGMHDLPDKRDWLDAIMENLNELHCKEES